METYIQQDVWLNDTNVFLINFFSAPEHEPHTAFF